MPVRRYTRTPKTPANDKLMTVEEVMAEIGIGRDKVRALIHNETFEILPGLGPRTFRITRKSVDDYINGKRGTNGKRDSTGPAT
jgi:excisionase family DNA binding protein